MMPAHFTSYTSGRISWPAPVVSFTEAIDPKALKPRDLYLVATLAQYSLLLDQAAETFLLFGEFWDEFRDRIMAAGGEDGTISHVAGANLRLWLEHEWSRLWLRWLDGDRAAGVLGFQARRRQAVQIAVDAHRWLHGYYFAPIKQALTEQASSGLFGGVVEAPDAPPFTDQVQAVLDARDQQLIGSPPFTWSQRLWIHQNGGLNAMTQTISGAVAQGMSAWDLARRIEPYLYVRERYWPRWTRSRLYRMTPAERLVNRAGLLRTAEEFFQIGPASSGSVAYNALRLARTELQAIHNAATRALMLPAPWVEKIHIHRSAVAIDCRVCDPLGGAPGGDGIVYDKNDAPLPPFHPHCLCYQTADLMSRSAFIDAVRGWMRGENTFLDGYRPAIDADAALVQALSRLTYTPGGVIGLDRFTGDEEAGDDWQQDWAALEAWFRGQDPTHAGTSIPTVPEFEMAVVVDQKDTIVRELSRRTGIDYDVCSDFVHQWACTSNGDDYRSVSIQRTASDLFGVPLSDWQQAMLDALEAERRDHIAAELGFDRGGAPGILDGTLCYVVETESIDRATGRPILRDGVPYATPEAATQVLLQAMYDHTQAALHEAGIERLVLYRGTGVHGDQAAQAINWQIGQVVADLTGNALSSYSIREDAAWMFTQGNDVGALYRVEAPARCVLGSARTGFGCLNEWEVVLLGMPDGEAEITDIVIERMP